MAKLQEELLESRPDIPPFYIDFKFRRLKEHDTDELQWALADIKLYRGDMLIFSTELTILNQDFEFMVDSLSSLDSSGFEFEPMEPDFSIEVKPIESSDESSGSFFFVTCFLNDLAKPTGFDKESGVGIRFGVSRTQIIRFAKELRNELDPSPLSKS